MRLIVEAAAGDFEIEAESWEQLAGVMSHIRADYALKLASSSDAMRTQAERIRELTAELANAETVRQFGAQLKAEHDAALEARDRALEQLEEAQKQTAAARRTALDKDRLRRALNSELRTVRSDLEMTQTVLRDKEAQLRLLKGSDAVNVVKAGKAPAAKGRRKR